MAGKMSHKKFREMNDHLRKGGVLIICPAGKLANWSLSGHPGTSVEDGFLQLAMKQSVLVLVHITIKHKFIILVQSILAAIIKYDGYS